MTEKQFQATLKPCPFCGSGNDTHEVCKTGVFWIRCGLCGSDGPSHKTRWVAGRAWNGNYYGNTDGARSAQAAAPEPR